MVVAILFGLFLPAQADAFQPVVPDHVFDHLAPTPHRGAPFFRYFAPAEYQSENQNWAVLQDPRGIAYFANAAGVLEFDGARWRIIPTSLRRSVRSIAQDPQGRIFVGGQGEFGLLKADDRGILRYVGLEHLIPQEARKFSDVLRIFPTPEGTYFQTREGLYSYRGDRITFWPPRNQFHLAFLVGNRLFVREFGLGLFELASGQLHLVPGGERFAAERIYVMLPLDASPNHPRGEILIGTQSAGFFRLDHDGIRPMPCEASTWLKKSRDLFCGIKLRSGILALGTLSKGLIWMDQQGKILGAFSRQDGLPDDSVYAMSEASRGCWVAHDNGITFLEWPSPLTVFDQRHGLKGRILSICRHHGQLYVGTTFGVFVQEITDGPRRETSATGFQRVMGPRYQATALAPFGNVILCGSQTGVFEIKDRCARQVSGARNGFRALLVSRRFTGRVYLGLTNGLITIHKIPDGRWVEDGNPLALPLPISSITELENGQLWVSMEGTNDLARITPAVFPKYLESRIEWFKGPGPYPFPFTNQVLPDGNSPLFTTPTGMGRLDEARRAFVLDPALSAAFQGSDGFCRYYATDRTGGLWLSTTIQKQWETGVALLEPDGSRRWLSAPFRRLSTMRMDVIYPDDQGLVWFGGADGLIRYDPAITLDTRSEFPVRIRKLERAGERVIDGGGNPVSGKPLELGFSNKTLRFEYAYPSYEGVDNNKYQVLLEGHDRAWSEWSGETFKEFTNLREGTYRFRVRGQNAFGSTSQEADFLFRIRPPWFRTWLFMLMEATVLLFLATLIPLLYIRNLRFHNRILRERSALLSERNLLALELHDDLSQLMTAIMLHVETARKILAVDPEDGRGFSMLDRVAALTKAGLEETRRTIKGLQTPLRETNDLLDRFRSMASGLFTGTNVHIQIEQNGLSYHLPKKHLESVFRVGQEALTNAIRHGQACHVEILLLYDTDYFRISVRDDGTGFDLEEMRKAKRGMGLKGMADRMESVGGTLQIISYPSKGTLVEGKIHRTPAVLKRGFLMHFAERKNRNRC